MKTIYHIDNGASQPMYEIDAAHAVGNFPDEWSETEWTDAAKADVAKRKAEADKAAAAAKK